MDPESSLVFAGIAVCFLLLAFTSAVDAAFSAISRHRLNAMGDSSRSRRITYLLDDPYRFKVAVLLINTVSIVVATALTMYVSRSFALEWRIGVLGLLLLLMLFFGEAMPKALALRSPSQTAALLSAPMVAIAWLLWPLITVFDLSTRPLAGLLSGQRVGRSPLVTEEELRLLVNVSQEEGLIEADERQMIEGIFSFGDTLVREVMVPRVDVVAIEAGTTIDEALDIIISNGHSRLPVYDETIDQIVGILHIKNLLPALRRGQHDMPLDDILRETYFVPETMKVDVLLQELRNRNTHLAVVVDEYGGTAGLITIEDLVEEIVGDIRDEYDNDEEPSFQEVEPGELIADARVLLDDINTRYNLALTSEDADRLGGLVYEHLGRVPTVGDVIELPNGITITVLSIEGLSARRLRLRYPPESDSDGEMAQRAAVAARGGAEEEPEAQGNGHERY